MKNASVTLTLNLNMNVPDGMANDKIEGAAYWLLKPFLDGFYGQINGCELLANSVNIVQGFTSVEAFVDNKIAEHIEIKDDGQDNGGIGYIGETLDHFIQEEQDRFAEYGKGGESEKFVYSIPLGVVNGALTECGIEMLTPSDIQIAMEKASANKC